MRMDKNTVFVKTREGEEAVRQRAGLAQRNLRSLLIMVDGHATAAELAKRFGDEGAAHAALAELEAGGLIAEVGGAPDLAAPPPAPVSGEESDEATVSAAHEGPSATPIDSPEAPAAASAKALAGKPRSSPSGWLERIRALLAGMGGKPAAQGRNAVAGEDVQTIAAIDPEPIGRGRKSFFGRPWLIPLAVLGIAVLAGLTLALYPYGRHLPDIERAASAVLHDPVKIGDIGFSFLPRPHIALRNITVGRQAHLTIASVRAVPDFLSLMGERKVFHELGFDAVRVKVSGLDRLALAGTGSGSPAVEIRRLTLNDMSLVLADAVVEGLGGEIVMSVRGVPEKILLRNADNTLKFEFRPEGERYPFIAAGSEWHAPFLFKPKFQRIDLQGELRAARLELSRVEGATQEGLVEGKASLDWAGGAMLSGELEIKHMNMSKLLAALGSELAAEGELTARLKLEARADSLGKLAEALRAGGTFEMKRGTARGFDLGEVLRARAPTRGGETKFEQLSGEFSIDREGCRLDNLRLGSGLLKAGGKLGIARDGQLSGALEVELKGTSATLRLPLAVGGTARDPVLTPGRGR